MSEFKLSKVEKIQNNDSKYIKPFRMHYNLNEKNLSWDCMKIHDSVAILLYNKSRQKVILVKQFRPAVYLATACPASDLDKAFDNVDAIKNTDKNLGYTLECCAGIIDKEKSPAEIAKDEIFEETGYDVPLSAIRFLSSYRSSVGISGSIQYLYFCEVSDDQRANKGGGIDDEQIEVIELSIEEVKGLLWCKDEEALCARPASMLFALSWFLYEYLPKL